MVYPVAVVLALILPFEAIKPVVVTPWVSLTDDRLVLLAAAVAWLLLGPRALPTKREWRALAASLTLVAVAMLAALYAPAYGDDALKFVLRLLAATFVLLLALRFTHDLPSLAGILWAIVLGAGLSALVGLGEALNWQALEPLLSAFKVASTRIGPDLRVSATFQYATIAAMYFEMVVPLAIVLSATTARRWLSVLALGVALVCTANVVLSLTRAGMLTLAVTDILLLVSAWLRPACRHLLVPTLAACGVLVGGVAILGLRDPVFDMRLATESDADWYGAAYAAPASLSLDANQSANVVLDVRNEGRIVWSSAGKHPFALGYRWLTADGTGVLDVPPGEVPLPSDVSPGETVHLDTRVEVPKLPAGTYRLDWGMLQRDVLQFYERGWADAETLVAVGEAPNGIGVPMPTTLARDDGEAPWVVGRLELWGAAVRLAAARPLLGVGPDNFRHLYGAELGLESWDERVEANNVYLELLADMGILGLAAFAWLTLPPLIGAFRALRRPTGASVQRTVWLLGLSLGLLAFLVHGVLDSFLAFTPTALLFWMLLGMIVNLTRMVIQKPQVSGR